MKAIIPVAGIGTRLQPLTNRVPKVLINVGGKPMLFHLIDEMIKNGKIHTIILVIGYLGDQIEKAVVNSYKDSKIKFEFVEQKEMLGLGHAVYHGRVLVGHEPVLIILGDTIFEFDLKGILNSEYSAIGVKDMEDFRRYGIVETTGGFISRMIEKPSGPEVTSSRSAIAGVYFIKSGQKLFEAVEYLMEKDIRTKNEYQLTDALEKMIADGEKIVSFEIENWFDCGKPETLLSTNKYILQRDYSAHEELNIQGVDIVPPVYIGKNCNLEDCTIGPNATLSDGSSVKRSSVTNSLICEGAIVEDAELDEVVLGKNEHVKGILSRTIKADSQEVNF